MSTTIDNKIVEMSFNNSDFEKNAKQSIETTEKLKKSLDFNGVSSGLDQIGTAAKNCNVGVLATAAESVGEKFDAMKYIAIYALQDIYNMATQTASQLINLFAIQPVTSGFEEYELKMSSVQTIMNSSGENLSTVNGYLDELNTYADQTIYSFADMTQNIGKFTNAGVDLDKAVAAIKGISNEAAVSGANTNEASRAMYNFAQALSAGYVKLIDWKSIENANMATVEFKQQLIDTAVELGNLEQQADGTYKVLTQSSTGSTMDDAISATQNFNDSLQYQWMTTDVLVDTLNNYADETTAIGKKAYAAATEVKTFSMMMDTLTESAGSGWTETWEILIGDFEEAKSFWTDLTNYFDGIIGTMNDSRNNLLKGGLENGFDLIENKVKNAGISVNDFENKIKELGNASGVAVDDIIKECGSMGEAFAQGKLSTDLITQAITDLGPSAKLSETAIEQLNNSATGMFDNLKAYSGRTLLQESLFNILNTIKTIGGAISEAWNNSVEGLTSSKIYSVIETIHSATTQLYRHILTKSNQITQTFAGVFKLGSAIAKNVTAVVKGVINVLTNLFGTITGNAPDILDVTANIGEFFSQLADGIDISQQITAFFDDLISKLPELINQLKQLPIIGDLLNLDTTSIFEQIKSFGNDVVTTITGIVDYVKENGIQGIIDIFNSLKSSVSTNAGEFGNAIQGPSEEIINKIKDFLDKLGNAAVAIAPIVGSFLVLKSIADTIQQFAKAIETLAGPLSGAQDVLNSTHEFIDEFKKQVKSCGKALSFAIKTEAFINLAVAVGIISLAIAGLATIASNHPVALIAAIVAVGLIIAALVGVMIYAQKLNEADIAKLQTVSKLALGIATVVGVLGALVYVFGTMDLGSLAQGIIATGVVLVMLGAFLVGVTKLSENADIKVTATFNNIARIVLSIGAAFLMISYGIRLMATCDTAQLALGAVIFAVFAIFIGALLVCMYKLSGNAAKATVFGNLMTKVGNSILMVGQSFALISLGIFMIGQLSEEQLNRAMSVLGKVIVFMGLFIVVMSWAQGFSDAKVVEFNASILAVVGAIAILTLLALALSYVDPLSFLKGVALLAAVSAVAVALYAAMSFVTQQLPVGKLTSMGLSLIAMTTSIALMAAIAVLLGYCDPVKLSQGIVFVGILAAFASMMAVAASTLNKDDIAALASMAACVAILAVIAVVFTTLDQAKLATSVAALDSLILCFAAFAKMMSTVEKMTIPVGRLAILLGVVIVLAAIVAALSAIDGTEKAASIGVGIAAMMVSFGIVVAILESLADSTLGAKEKLTAMLPAIGVAVLIMAACGGLIAAVCALAGDQVDKAVEVATAVSMLMLSLTACIYALNTINGTGIDSSVIKTMGVLLGALVVVGGVIVVMVNTIGDKVLEAYEVAGALALMLGVLTGCVIALSNFGNTSIDDGCYYSILALSVALIPIGIVIGLMCAFVGANVQYAYTVAIALSIAIGALSLCAIALSKWSGLSLDKSVYASLVVLSLCLIPIGAVIGVMCALIGDKASSAIPIAGALAIVITVLAGIAVALSVFKTGTIDASIIVTIGVLAACLAALGVVLGYVINSIGANANAAIPIAAALSLAIVALAGAAVILGNYHGTLTGGLEAVVVLDALLLSLIGILTILGGLNTLTDGAVVNGVNTLMQIIEIVAEGIGKIVNGIGVGMSESLIEIATNISVAMMAANMACATVDESNLSKIQTFGEALAALGKGQLIEGLGNLLGMKMTDVITVLTQLGLGVRSFAMMLVGVDVATVEQGANAAKALCEGLSNIPMEGGFLDNIFGTHNYDKFAAGVESIAKALPVFVNAVGDINTDSVQPSCEALKTIMECFSNIENTGGLLQDVLGGKNYDQFANGLESIGQALPKYVAAVGDTSTENVQPSADALKYLLEVLKDMPTEGGWISIITGGNVDYDKFTEVLPKLGTALKEYCNNVSGANFTMGHEGATNLSIIVNTLKNMQESGVSKDSVNGFSEAIKALTEVDMDKLKSMYGGSDSATVFSKIAETINTGITDAINDVDFASAGQSLNSKLIEGLKTAFSTDSSGNLHEMISNVAQSLYSGESTSSFRTVGVNLANMFKMGLEEGMQTIDNALTSIDTLASSIETQCSSKFTTVGTNAANWFTNGFRQTMQTSESISELFNNLCGTLYSNYSTRFNTLALNLANMFKDGFKSGISGVNAAVDDIITQIGNTHGTTIQAIGANLGSKFKDGWNVSIKEVGSIDTTLNAIYLTLSNYSSQFTALGANLAGFFKDGVRTGLGELTTAVYDAIQNIYTSNAVSIYTVGVNLGSSFKDGIVKSFEFTDSFTSAFETLYNSISNYDTKFQTLGTNSANWFKNGFNTALNDVSSITSSFSAMYLDLSGYMSRFYTLGINLANMFKDGFKTATNSFSEVFDSIITQMYNTNSVTTATIGANLGNQLKTGFRTAMGETDSFDMTLNSIYQTLSGYSVQFNTLGVNLANFFKDGVRTGLGELTTAVYDAIQNIYTSNAVSIYTVGVNLGSSFKDGIVKSFEFTDSFTNAITTAFASAEGTVNSAISNVCAAGVSTAETSYSSYYTVGINLINGLSDGIQAASSSTQSATAIACAAGILAVVAALNLYTTAGNTLASALATGIRNGVNEVNSAVNDLVSSACSTISSAATNTFTTAGYNAALGFANGISSGSFAAVIAATAMATAASNAAKSALNEHSPSRVFFGIGDYAAQGLALGMEDRTNMVERAGANIATSAIAGYNSVAGGSLFDMNTSIIPSIDYAAISSNTGKLDFSATMNRLIADPVKTSADRMAETQARFEASNQKIVDGLSAVQNDLSAYTTAVANSETAMYLDGKKVASSLAKPMNKAMGTLARQSKL